MDAKLREIITTDGMPSESDLIRWSNEYPYFVVPALKALRAEIELSDELRKQLRRQLAISVRNRDAISDVLGEDLLNFADFYPQNKTPELTTNDTIDTFLEKFCGNRKNETDALTKMIFNPTPDYASILAAEEKQSLPSDREMDESQVDERELRINQFIARQKSDKSSEADKTNETPTDLGDKSDKSTNSSKGHKVAVSEPESASLTESFAKIMIKNGNYSKALQIITDLSLKNSEKSIYFADQIRFLQKLIINEKNK